MNDRLDRDPQQTLSLNSCSGVVLTGEKNVDLLALTTWISDHRSYESQSRILFTALEIMNLFLNINALIKI